MVNNSMDMGKRKSKEIAIEHYKSQLNIHQHFSCQECPIRIYADKNECITFGAGITFAKTIFILFNFSKSFCYFFNRKFLH